jgi:hypothetical protein
MGTAVHGTNDLASVVSRVLRRSIDPDLTAIPIGMGAKQATPVTHLPPSPVLAFGIPDRIFNVLLRVARSRHRCLHYVAYVDICQQLLTCESLEQIPVRLNALSFVMRGLDPRIHADWRERSMFGGVKPGNDGVERCDSIQSKFALD